MCAAHGYNSGIIIFNVIEGSISCNTNVSPHEMSILLQYHNIKRGFTVPYLLLSIALNCNCGLFHCCRKFTIS